MSLVQLLEWNRTEADYPRDCTIAELFAQQAARTPDAIAAGRRRPPADLSRARRAVESACPPSAETLALSRTRWSELRWDAPRRSSSACSPFSRPAVRTFHWIRAIPRNGCRGSLKTRRCPCCSPPRNRASRLPLGLAGSPRLLDAGDPSIARKCATVASDAGPEQQSRLRHLHLRLHRQAQRGDGRKPQRRELLSPAWIRPSVVNPESGSP